VFDSFVNKCIEVKNPAMRFVLICTKRVSQCSARLKLKSTAYRLRLQLLRQNDLEIITIIGNTLQ